MMVARWGRELRAWVKTLKGLRGTNWWLHSSQGDVKFSIENMVSNIVITMYGARRVLDLSGGTLYKLDNCLTTMLYTETNVK